MTLFIDTASIREATAYLQKYPWIKGITTNPKLLKQGSSEFAPEEILRELSKLTSGPIYYQLTANTLNEMLVEAKKAQKILGEKLVIKITPSELNYAFCTQYASNFSFCFTALYTLAQAKLAQEAGAEQVVVYVNRMLTHQLNPYTLLENMCALFEEEELTFLAASIKSVEEFEATLIAGADLITLPPTTIDLLSTHILTTQACEDFKISGIGI